jgi:hypothetical protein
MKKFAAVVELQFTLGIELSPEPVPFQQQFRDTFYNVLRGDILLETVEDTGGWFSEAEKMWHEHNYVFLLKVRLYSHKSLSNLHSMCSIYQHWAILKGASFQILEFGAFDPESLS